ncbi:TlpA family protein disulfide reductase [Jiella pacifica]|uniref:Redoxin domain-containing protein n=1 Tax=Jiella pacifica TaxID=2696469 RepID=A0A6N9SX66_9HYPH|nr:TlpA disulfide reductase family protein [Jiella pacifica]NDW03624.1 redoxin domain-containing protein [Jiella pacifica]
MANRVLLLCLVAGLSALPATAAVATQPAGTVSAESVTVSDARGEQKTVADLISGQPTILHFWATWCAPCREELPRLDAFASGLESGGLGGRLVVISVDTKPHQRITAFLDEVGATHLTDWQIAEGNAGSAFRLFGYPATLLMRPDGTLAERLSGPVDWDDPDIRNRFTTFLRGE